MTALSLPSRRLDHVLGGAAALLIVLLVWPWLQSPSAVRAEPPRELSAAAPELSPMPPLARFSVIGERPLFSSSRRPVPGDKAAPAGPGIEQRYRLLGILTTGESRRALLAEGKRRFALSEGTMLEGWRIAHIEHDRIVLSSPAGEAVLQLQPATGGEGWVDPSPVARPTMPEKPPPEKPQR